MIASIKTARIILLMALVVAFCACDNEPEARTAVLEFIRGLDSNRPVALEQYLDLNELVRENAVNVYTYNDSLSIADNIRDFEKLFAVDGKIRRIWTSKQIVVGDCEIRGDTAFVEVSFIDRDTRKQYYNKMGLKKTEQGWLIFAFKLL